MAQAMLIALAIVVIGFVGAALAIWIALSEMLVNWRARRMIAQTMLPLAHGDELTRAAWLQYGVQRRRRAAGLLQESDDAVRRRCLVVHVAREAKGK